MKSLILRSSGIVQKRVYVMFPVSAWRWVCEKGFPAHGMKKVSSMSKLQVISVSVLCFAGCASVFSLIFYFGDWPRLMSVVVRGVFLGLLAAPSIKPKAFKHAWAYELLSGAMSGALLGMVLAGSGEAVAGGALIGGVLGYMVPCWIKHVPIP